jgi:hypothetical protein
MKRRKDEERMEEHCKKGGHEFKEGILEEVQ